MSFTKKKTTTLKTKLIGALVALMACTLIVNICWNYYNQEEAIESELLEGSRSLSTMMGSVWTFASVNKEKINTSSSGEYDYKGLHCSLVGKSVGAIFSKTSDYSFRFVNFDPRNENDLPDEYEAEALAAFAEDETNVEYNGFSEVDGEKVYRYVYAMKVTEECLECHGQPAGEIDIAGYPKEGWDIGDLAGAGSIIVPTDVYFTNLENSIRHDALFFAGVIALVALGLYFALSKLVVVPLESMQSAFRNVGKGALDVRLDKGENTLYETREFSSMVYSFNNMASELSELYSNLEDQVAHRTEELNRANADLEAQRQKIERINEQLQEESQHKSDFLALVSHELRTPLTSILAFAELLEGELSDANTEARDQLKKIAGSGRSLLALVNNLLDSARIEAGKQTIAPDTLDLYDSVGSALSLVRPIAAEKSIELSFATKGAIPLIQSDPEMIERILQNLLSNAIKFTQEEGSVSVFAFHDEKKERVVIEIEDTGIGISEEQQQLVFDRFIQGDMTAGRKYGGSGLGLSLVSEMVELLGGTLSLTSELGKGSVFAVSLPLDCPATPIPRKDEDHVQDSTRR